MSIVVIDTKAANIASVCAALERVGATIERTVDPQSVRSAAQVVLPGVGSFGAVRERLSADLSEALIARVEAGLPTLGICLGMQLFATSSEESPGVAGLSVLDTVVRHFSAGTRAPQLGWNGVTGGDSRWIRDGAAYFANSYRIADVPSGWTAALTDHGGLFAAALERGDVLLCQFHPELSGEWGLDLLRRWVVGQPDDGMVRPAPSSLTKRIIPCLDVRDGRVVKGVRFASLRDAGNPAELAEAYAAQGADELCMLDVSATPEGRSTAADTVARIRARVALPLTVGGGVRSVEDARRLLNAGADKVAVNTAAVADPSLLTRLCEALGRQCVVLAVDAAQLGDSWEVVTQSGKNRTGIDAIAWCQEAQRRGAGEVLLTSWDRDGTRSGYDLDLVRAVSSAIDLPVIASGGARTASDLALAYQAGAEAALAASVFHDGDTTVAALKDELVDLDIHIRSLGGAP